MKKLIKSFKARTVSFFQRPIKKLKLKFACYLQEEINREVNHYITTDEGYVDMDRRLDRLEDNTVDYDNFNSALWDDCDFVHHDEKLDSHENRIDDLYDNTVKWEDFTDLQLKMKEIEKLIQDACEEKIKKVLAEEYKVELTLKPKE